jgi:protocatechuate 3,4-dioxygenase beta subunit
VVDENDKPVSEAQVGIYMLLKNKQYLTSPVAPTLLSYNTNEDGKFIFKNLPLGTTADFLVEKTGYARTITWSANSRLRYTVGQTDIKLVLPIEARIEGIVVEKKTGKPVAGIRLIVKEQNRWVQDAFDSQDDGTFSINSLTPDKYKLEVLPPKAKLADWAAEPVEVTAVKGKTTNNVRIELVKGGVLEIAVTDAVSGRLVENAGVTVLNKPGNQSFYGRSGKDGIIRIRLIPGDYFLWDGVYKQGYSIKEGKEHFTIADGKTERLEYTIFPESRITGTIRDEKGTPLEGATLMAWPFLRQQKVVTKAGGKFEVVYDKQNLASGEFPTLLLCRYENDNLAAALEIDEDVRTLDITLKSGISFAGKVVDPNGNGIEGAKLYVSLCKPSLSWPITPINPRCDETITDIDGKFEIKAIPTGHRYNLSIEAEGYGDKHTKEINTNDAVKNQLDMGNITLAVANLSISGVVVDENDEPITGAVVSGRGTNQPYRMTKTDVNGKFTLEGICAGKIRIGAVKFGAVTMLGSVDTEVGATNIKIVISEKSSHPRYVPKQPASLMGKPLPELKDLQMELPSADINNKRILICFWDMNQRPSRNCILELAGHTKELKDKTVIVAAVQASAIDKKALTEWINEHDIPFVVGMISDNVEKTKSAWNVRSLPWLILTDKQHVVQAEGFGIEEITDKIKNIKQ